MNHPEMTRLLLEWYGIYGRDLPWRHTPRTPYRIWLSEMMLQQTTVITVIPYYHRFLEQWPTLESLASNSQEDVLHAWQGLGYYSRARSLHRCAQHLVAEHGGVFPSNPSELEKLPGIGPYTASAIASIAFQIPSAVVDGNVIRVMSRLLALESSPKNSLSEIRTLAQLLTSHDHADTYAQAIMDLGATVCRPKNPECPACPWQKYCLGAIQGNPERYPLKLPKAKIPQKYAQVFWIQKDQNILIEKRPEKGLLGNLWQLPTTPWVEEKLPPLDVSDSLKKKFLGEVHHVFTHFKLTLSVYQLDEKSLDLPLHEDRKYVSLSTLDDYPFPTLMRKVLTLGGQNGGMKHSRHR